MFFTCDKTEMLKGSIKIKQKSSFRFPSYDRAVN